MLESDNEADDERAPVAPIMEALDALDQGLLLFERSEEGQEILKAWNPAALRCLELAEHALHPAALRAELTAILALRGEREGAPVRLSSGRLVLMARRELPHGGSVVACLDAARLGGEASQAADAGVPERAVLESAPAGILCVTPDGKADYANMAALDLFGTSLDELVVTERLLPSDDQPLTWHLSNTQRFEARIPAPYFDRHMMVSVSPLVGDGKSAIRILSLTDVTLLKRANSRIEFLAKHDTLTGLGNRMKLKSVWDEVEPLIVSESRPVHAIALDLDHFKQVNDQHGHAVGDELLRQVASRLRTAAGDASHLFRFGGDEFFVLMEGVSRREAIETAERIVEQMGDPFVVHGHDVQIGCSAGIASAPFDGMSRDQLHRGADLALYEVKRKGRNGIACFDPVHEQALLERRLIQTDLALAIANEGFHLQFQRHVEAGTQRTLGVEALLRWENRRLSRLVSPSEFIPLAEQAGLVHLIDIWMVRNALAHFARFAALDRDCPSLSVNLSPLTLAQEDFPALIERALDAHAVPADRLEIEISEQVAASDTGQSREFVDTVARLRALGVRLVIDNFGAGRGNFAFLQALSVSRLKLDRSIVQRIGTEDDSSPVVASIWDLCRRLGLTMTAEGVETEQQWAALQGIGNLQGQGFHLGLPEDPEAMLERLASERSRRRG